LTVDRAEFWTLIERSLGGNEHDCEAQTIALVSLLSDLSREEMQSFAARFSELEHRADRWDIRGVGYILQQGNGRRFLRLLQELVGRTR
jgi:hypothetical protein